MYEDIHEAAKPNTTTLNHRVLVEIFKSPSAMKKAITKDWQRIDQLIFKSSDNKE